MHIWIKTISDLSRQRLEFNLTFPHGHIKASDVDLYFVTYEIEMMLLFCPVWA